MTKAGLEPEIEAKFLHINHVELRKKLESIGAKKSRDITLMRRKNYDFPDQKLNRSGGWVRVRDEGDKITLSYKQLQNRTLTGTKEIQVTVENFELTDQFLRAIGLSAESYQETKRESWVAADGTQIELDEWPWIQAFAEIEGKSEQVVRQVAEELGLDWTKAVHGSVEIAYMDEFDVTEDDVNAWPEITFSDVPDWLEAKRRK